MCGLVDMSAVPMRPFITDAVLSLKRRYGGIFEGKHLQVVLRSPADAQLYRCDV